LFGADDVLLHGLDEDVVVEVNDVLLLFSLGVDCHLNVNVLDVLLMLKHVSILCNDVVEGDQGNLRCLANSVNSAHNELIEVSVGE
jgi:hypothetical protein